MKQSDLGKSLDPSAQPSHKLEISDPLSFRSGSESEEMSVKFVRVPFLSLYRYRILFNERGWSGLDHLVIGKIELSFVYFTYTWWE